jgi:hypothetical protein
VEAEASGRAGSWRRDTRRDVGMSWWGSSGGALGLVSSR